MGTVKVEVLSGYRDGLALYTTISLTDTLYISGFPLNIISSYKFYTSGGTLIKQKLYLATQKVIILLNF